MRKNSKNLIVLVCILLAGSSVVSASIESLTVGKNNDWYTMGLGYNYDDGLSYGSSVEAVFSSSFTLSLTSGGYTDRINTEQRYDVVSLVASYPLQHQWFTFTPRVGFVASGDLAFDEAQNFLHSFIGRDLLNLTYATEELSLHPSIGGRALIGYKEGMTKLSLEFDLDYSHNWEQTYSGNLRIQFGSFLSVRMGYLQRSTSHSFALHEEMVERYQGPFLSYQYDGGLLHTQFISYLETGRSFGGFSFDVVSLWKKKQFRSADFVFSTGFLYDLIGQQNRLFSFSYKTLSFEIRHKNGPMFNDMEDQEDRLNVGSWMIGYSWNIPITPRLVPYGKLLAGIQRFNLQYDFTNTVVESLHPTIAVEIGLKGLGIPGWVIEKQNYRLRFTSTLQYVFGTDEIADIDSSFSEHIGPWILMTGIVIDVEHDQG
ncbi:hypothetical protein GRZ57_07360 [Sphaerochaeta halotolerans]|nr:hypothetical protein [Sphaerochaeta halotolerans]